MRPIWCSLYQSTNGSALCKHNEIETVHVCLYGIDISTHRMCSKIVNNTRIAVNITKYLFFVTIIQCIHEYLAGACMVIRKFSVYYCIYCVCEHHQILLFSAPFHSDCHHSVLYFFFLPSLRAFLFTQIRCSTENITNIIWIHKQSSGVTVFIVYLCIYFFPIQNSLWVVMN